MPVVTIPTALSFCLLCLPTNFKLAAQIRNFQCINFVFRNVNKGIDNTLRNHFWFSRCCCGCCRRFCGCCRCHRHRCCRCAFKHLLPFSWTTASKQGPSSVSSPSLSPSSSGSIAWASRRGGLRLGGGVHGGSVEFWNKGTRNLGSSVSPWRLERINADEKDKKEVPGGRMPVRTKIWRKDSRAKTGSFTQKFNILYCKGYHLVLFSLVVGLSPHG